ncbi:hypothetical protein [Peribacillus butanolivorans]|uniref:hypothetical protein n=1 Tax=Peribacillus butanolivorans TaxID=421767 RepID=UPI0035DBB5D0
MKSVGQQNVRSINGQELQGKNVAENVAENVAVTPTNQRQTIQQVIVNRKIIIQMVTRKTSKS